ncbi:MAG: CSLREA domain-containing protein [Acidobacteria bacterium]|nr:CSLREA domain-containing protein [Acidobacteriota bacterium]
MRSIKTGLSAFLLLAFLSVSAFAATFTVTKTADTNDGTCDADCSLREAIAAANAASGDDIIEFSSLFDSQQTITLSGTELVLEANGSITISGPGAGLLTISGNNASRILVTGPNVVATIDGITFTAGNGVGALNNGRGGAIYNAGGTLTITNSVITNNNGANGGGLNNASSGSPAVPGTLIISNSVISNNTATGSGGAMQNFSTSTVTITNTTISGNVSNGTTGGGGGQYNGRVNFTNVTFANNSAPSGSGGGFQTNGTLGTIITNVTVVNNSSLNNGGGIHRGTTNVNFFIRNSIVAGNNGTAASPDVTNSTGGLQSEGNNIIGNVGTSTGWVASDLQNTAPLLGPLADNGGFGQTFLPQAGSPAIDAGQNCVRDLTCSANNPPAAVTEDQRGISRLTNGNVDIGAVEVASAVPVSIGGRVFSSADVALPLALVSVTDGNETRYFITNSFGYYSFEGLTAGTEYTVSVSSKAASFTPQVVTPANDISDLDFLPAMMLKADEK